MLTCMLKVKLHRAVVTGADLHYEGSLLIDADILEKAGLHHYEQVRISNINNGERFETYVIPGKRGSREFCLNGSAARKAMVGDRIIVFSYAYLSDEELKNFKPRVIIFNEENEIITP